MATAKKASEKVKITGIEAAVKTKPASKSKSTKQVFSKADLQKALREYFGFDAFKGNQEAIILNLLAGNDTFVIKPTGGGKKSLLPASGHYQ